MKIRMMSATTKMLVNKKINVEDQDDREENDTNDKEDEDDVDENKEDDK